MDTKMTSVSNKVDSMDTKVDRDVIMIVDMNSVTQGWRYLGRGIWLGHETESATLGTTLSQCAQICESKHSADHQWNGFLWNPSNSDCYCQKNDKGHDPTQYIYYMHFMKQ